MNYRKLGATGLEVSELSYGAARGALEEPEAFLATIQVAIEGGINLIDSSPQYANGECERLLGRALRGREDILVQTKYLPYESFAPEAFYIGSPDALKTSVEGSLRRLGRDHLDILLGHGMRTLESYDRFLHDGCYAAMVELRTQGKVRFIGISELSEADGTHEVLRRAVPSGAFDVVMLTVNFLLQTAIDSVLPLCHEHRTGTVVMMPLNQANNGSGLVGVSEALECVRRHIAECNLPAEPPYTSPDLFDFLAPLSIPEAALRFVLSQNVASCCVGARRPGRLQENLRAAENSRLDEWRLAHLRELFGKIRRQVR